MVFKGPSDKPLTSRFAVPDLLLPRSCRELRGLTVDPRPWLDTCMRSSRLDVDDPQDDHGGPVRDDRV